MAKTNIKSVYFCNSCGHESPKWMGRCPACGEWNTFVEEKVSTKQSSRNKGLLDTEGARPI